MTLGGANVWTNFSYGYRNESPSGWLLSPDRSRLILFTRNKKSPRNSMRIFAHTYYANDLGEPMAIKSSTQMYLDCLLYTSPSPRDRQKSRMPSSA